MAIVLNDSIRVAGNKPVEDKRLNNGVPYTSIAEVNSSIIKSDRYPTLEVCIRTAGVDFIYWYKDGVENENLTLKQEGGGGEGTLPGVMVFRDTVPTKPDLNAVTGQKQGDVYGVVSESKLYVWIIDYANIPGNNIWKDMGVSVDFSDYYKKGEIDTKLNSYVLSNFLNQNFYNKTDVDNKLTSVLREQPNVDSPVNLPSTGNKVGDIRKAGDYRYIFSADIDDNGTDGWDILVPLTDLRNYYTSAETEAAIANKNYITAAYLANYATQNWVTSQGYATNTDLALKQDKSAKVVAWNSTVSDNNYPSEKLVKDSLDATNTNANNKLDKTTATNQSVESTVTFSNTVTIPKLVMTTQTSNTTVYALWSDGTTVYFNGSGGTPKKIAYDNTGVNVPVIHLTNASIDISTAIDVNGWKMHGKSIVHDNSSDATILVSTSADPNFICEGCKVTNNLTFVAGSGVNIIQESSTLVVNGNKGSSYRLRRISTSDYILAITNL